MDMPKVEMSALAITWHWDVKNDIPDDGSALYVVVEKTLASGVKEYRLCKHAVYYSEYKTWYDEDGWNLLTIDEWGETKQIFVWAYMPDDTDIFPTSAMTSILQKKRLDNA